MTHRLAPAVAALAVVAFAGSSVFAAGPENRAVVYKAYNQDRPAAPVRIVINESMSTMIDPAVLVVSPDTGLDENHSMLRAARLHNSLTGVTTRDLAEIRNAMVAPPSMSNRAYHIPARGQVMVITQKDVEMIQAMQRNAPTPKIEVKPKRKSVPIPSVPKPDKSHDGDEKIA